MGVKVWYFLYIDQKPLGPWVPKELEDLKNEIESLNGQKSLKSVEKFEKVWKSLEKFEKCGNV